MYPNALPWWLTWIDGRVLLIVLLIAAMWLWYWLSLNDANIYDANDCCKACGEHIAEAHQPDCALDAEYYDEQ